MTKEQRQVFIVRNVRCSYPNLRWHIWQNGQPVILSDKEALEKANGAGKPQRTITLMFDKKNEAQVNQLKEIKKIAMGLLAVRWPNETARPKINFVGGKDSPIKDADKGVNKDGVIYKDKNPEYENHYLINVNNRISPINSFNTLPIVDAVAGPDGKPINLTPDDIYGGCWIDCKFMISTRAMPSAGISFYLNAIKKVNDDESFNVAGNTTSGFEFDDPTEKAGGYDGEFGVENGGGLL